MFYVNPQVQPQFDSLSPELKTYIQEKDVRINSMNDLMRVLEDITKEGE